MVGVVVAGGMAALQAGVAEGGTAEEAGELEVSLAAMASSHVAM